MKCTDGVWGRARAHGSRWSLTGLALLACAGLLAACSGYDGSPSSTSKSSTSGVKPSGARSTPSAAVVTERAGPGGAAVGGATPTGVAWATVPGVAGEPEMRVRLLDSAASATLSSTVRSLWIGARGAARPPARLNGPVEVKLSASSWEFTDASGVVAKFERGAIVEVASEEGMIGPGIGEGGGIAPGTSVQAGGAGGGVGGSARAPSGAGAQANGNGALVVLNGKRYAGVVQFRGRSEVSPRAFDAIETVQLEDYLKGVVAAEMFPGWPLAAYQAQAVAARSYALHERTRARGAGQSFDIESSVRDQAYGGVASRGEAARAVDTTRGVALTWNGAILRAYFHSTCGGRSASASDTWPTTGASAFNLAGPVQAQRREWACNGATYYRWSVVRNRQELLRRFRAFGAERGTPLKGLTGIESIIASSTNTAGRPNRYLVMQPGGQTYTLTAEELRRACNQEVGTLPTIAPASRVNSGDMEIAVAGNSVTISGRGYGHGVGLCQWCAKGFADKGESWQSILMRFFPGARAERVY